jgi:putative hydrolase of the HAD superfamily
MQRARIVSFDMDGTITDISFADSVWLEGMPHEYALKEGVSFEVAKKRVMSEYCKVGKERLEWYNLSYWIEKLGLNITPKEILGRFESRIRVFPEVVEVLEELRSEGFGLIIVTNARREFADFELEKTAIKRYFEGIFSATSDFGLVKNTVDAYRKVCSMCNVSPEQIIHVGDDECFDFDVPRKLGMTAFYLDRTGDRSGEFVVRSLKEFSEKLLDGLGSRS